MKRSTLFAVAMTALVLIVAGNLPRIPGMDFARAWRAPAVNAVAGGPVHVRREVARAASVSQPFHLAMGARPALPRWSRPLLAPPRLPAPVEAALFVTAGILAGLGLLALLAMSLRRDARARVYHLARRGAPMSRIARDSRMAQDAVRTLLVPGLGARRG